MNFDNLKEAWANDKPETQLLPAIPQGKTSAAVASIRRNMRIEFISQLVALALLIFFVRWASVNRLSFFLVGIAAFLLAIQTIYYLFRFYIFFRSMSRYDLAMKKSLRKIVYELELNIEIYRTFNYCAVPLIILIIVCSSMDLTSYFSQTVTDGTVINYNALLIIFLVLLISQIISFFFLNLHIRLQYGRHLGELKKILEDIEE